jgi:hypothetical protein
MKRVINRRERESKGYGIFYGKGVRDFVWPKFNSIDCLFVFIIVDYIN